MTHEPLYACADPLCERVNLSASELREHEGLLYCEECWECEIRNEKLWTELPAFVPDHEKRIAELEKDLEDYKTAAEADEAKTDEALNAMTDGVLQMTARIRNLEAEVKRLKVQNTALGAC